MLTRFAVVVPAHDEQDLLPSCLTALRTAAAAVTPLPVEVIVVADDCHDATAAVAHRHGARVVTVRARNVGAARAAGMAYAMRRGAAGLWLATTDADSRVRPDWLQSHLDHARRGTQLVVGTVAVDDWTGWPAAIAERYETRYRAGLTAVGHEHVHGANLGCAAGTYVASGGFSPVPNDEDRDLVERVVAAGHQVVYDVHRPVATSARRVARAPAGFATFLTRLGGCDE